MKKLLRDGSLYTLMTYLSLLMVPERIIYQKSLTSFRNSWIMISSSNPRC